MSLSSFHYIIQRCECISVFTEPTAERNQDEEIQQYYFRNENTENTGEIGN
jgi:hypothetical protein